MPEICAFYFLADSQEISYFLDIFQKFGPKAIFSGGEKRQIDSIHLLLCKKPQPFPGLFSLFPGHDQLDLLNFSPGNFLLFPQGKFQHQARRGIPHFCIAENDQCNDSCYAADRPEPKAEPFGRFALREPLGNSAPPADASIARYTSNIKIPMTASK